ncbi:MULTISPECIES: hypothetical protein [unclassified Serratia (in: enterobacteria)]|uniref:hypothetical protein n=1 Tax=unclassified Serratia (in: enterobacteria) TaxID=2647522 RepID=UPI000468139B|nr:MULTISPECIES: hypothetical protein [unclassified Serratia (in: enterobacteria)]
MTIKKIYQLECVPDFRYEETPSINYSDLADDAECKLISTLEAIGFLGITLMDVSLGKNIDSDKVNTLGGVISNLSEVAILLNGIAAASNNLHEIKSSSGHDANH